MDEDFARRLEAVEWFARCGEPLRLALPFPVEQVGSGAEALERCSDPSWENATLEAQNRLTAFLHWHARDDYQRWNTIAVAAKGRVVAPLAERVWRPFAARQGFGKVFVDCVEWDVLAAIMEHEYRRHAERPEFFLPLLEAYRAGHFPCGWRGAWPAGTLWMW